MIARGILKNWNLIADGRGYAGNLETYTPPALALATEEFRAGGMDAAVDLDMGMEKLEASFTLTGYDPEVLILFGIEAGADGVQLTARGATEDPDGRVHAEAHYMRGTITRLAQSAWTTGESAKIEITVALRYYRHEHDGRVLHEIDVPNMVRIVNGTDRLAEQRKAIGL